MLSLVARVASRSLHSGTQARSRRRAPAATRAMQHDAATWAEVLAVSERAAREGAIYIIDSNDELVTDSTTGVEARAL